MNNPEERSLEEWTKLRREVAMAEQQLASQTHELLREKQRVRDLEAELAAEKETGATFRASCLRRMKADLMDSDIPSRPRPWWRRLTFGAWCVVIAYFVLCACIIGGTIWFATQP